MTMRLIHAAGAAAALVAVAFPGPAEAGRRALLIGIDAYAQVKPLVGSRSDVNNMAGFLTSDWGFADEEVMLLTDEAATREGILSTIESWLIEGTEAGDEVVLYYSGHGYQQPDEDGDERPMVSMRRWSPRTPTRTARACTGTW